MTYNICNKLLIIVRAFFALSFLLFTINVKAIDLPKLPSLDDLELPELSMGDGTDTPESVSRPTSTMQQSFNKDLPPMPELEDDLMPPPMAMPDEDPLALPPIDDMPELPVAAELTLPEQSKNMNEDFPDMVDDNVNKESWWSTVKGWIGLNDGDGNDSQEVTIPAQAFGDPDEITQTMSDIDDMLQTASKEKETSPVDQLLEAPNLDDLDIASLDKSPQPEPPITDSKIADSNVTSAPQEANQEAKEVMQLPLEAPTAKTSLTPPSNMPAISQEQQDTSDELSLPMSVPESTNAPFSGSPALAPPSTDDTSAVPTNDDDEETWSEMFSRIWHNFKIWVGLEDEEVAELDLGPEAEYADENLELFDDPLTPKPESSTAQPAIAEKTSMPESLDEAKLDIVATEATPTPAESPVLQKKIEIKQEEPQEPEDPFVKVQNAFVQKEIIVLMMRDDDVVLGEISPDARYYYMHPRKYVHAFWKEFEWEARALAREKVRNFVNYYYNHQSLPTMMRRKQMQQYNDEIITAAYKGDLKSIRVLLQNYPELIDANDIYGNNMLHISVYKKYYDLAKFLIMNGIEIDPYNEFMETPLDMVPSNGAMSRLIYRAM